MNVGKLITVVGAETNLLLGHGRGGKRPDVKVDARLPNRRAVTGGSDRRCGTPGQGATRSMGIS